MNPKYDAQAQLTADLAKLPVFTHRDQAMLKLNTIRDAYLSRLNAALRVGQFGDMMFFMLGAQINQQIDQRVRDCQVLPANADFL